MRTRFYKPHTAPGCSTQQAKKYPRPSLSTEARRALRARRRHAALAYRQAMDETWRKVEEDAENIAVTHRKSVRRVQRELHMGAQLTQKMRNKTNAWNAFCWKKAQEQEPGTGRTGKELLTSLVQSSQHEYALLTSEEKKTIIDDFEQQKATKTKALRISTKSKIHDVNKTMAAIEQELNHLKSRTGVETLLFTSRGSTDLTMTGIAFATPGVEKFLQDTLKTDPQEFLQKMEGFAVAGVRGAAANHAQRVSALRKDIRQEILEGLRSITGDPSIRMEWKWYWRNVVSRHSVIIEGWPAAIPFQNLSTESRTISELASLLQKWRRGVIFWKTLTAEELQTLTMNRQHQINGGELETPAPRRRRSDFGKKRQRNTEDNDGNPRSRKSRKHISPDTIDSDDDTSNESTEASSSRELPPTSPSSA